MNINHPLSINTTISANHKICQCKGGGVVTIFGSIQKVITNQSGTWYYLSTGQTVNSNDVIGIQS